MNISDYEPVKELLDVLAQRYNTPEFIADDPVQFARRFGEQRDAEIASLLVSSIAWGKRSMILRNADRMLGILENEPYRFVMEGDIEAIGEDNIHRTFFGRHLRHYLRALRLLYRRYGSLENFAVALGAPVAEAPAWTIAEGINGLLEEANAAHPLDGPNRCIPAKPDTSALKRLNMALRWLVRNDGIVDLGMWKALRPSQLYIPLDVHSGNTARGLGLLERRQNDRRAVEELTGRLRRFNATDPVIYDFALFGVGVNGDTYTDSPQIIG